MELPRELTSLGLPLCFFILFSTSPSKLSWRATTPRWSLLTTLRLVNIPFGSHSLLGFMKYWLLCICINELSNPSQKNITNPLRVGAWFIHENTLCQSQKDYSKNVLVWVIYNTLLKIKTTDNRLMSSNSKLIQNIYFLDYHPDPATIISCLNYSWLDFPLPLLFPFTPFSIPATRVTL